MVHILPTKLICHQSLREAKGGGSLQGGLLSNADGPSNYSKLKMN